jgi:SAM-dependent methyltransferase
VLDRIGRALAREARRINPSGKLDGERLVDAALRFRRRLDKIKAGIPGVQWYPYDSLMNFYPVRDLLAGRYLMDLAGDKPVLDLGCGDGAVAFFMESLGARVHAVDNAATNYNGMRGVRALKDSLGASLEIHEMDLDGRFALPDAQYGLAFFLGTLYHLKNPFYALEAVARKTRYCLLSTRVARFTPGGAVDFHDLPMAWLLDDREANADSTNYWIFSEAGLRRLLGRAGWNVLAWTTSGDTRLSEPSSKTADERAFCLLERAGALD